MVLKGLTSASKQSVNTTTTNTIITTTSSTAITTTITTTTPLPSQKRASLDESMRQIKSHLNPFSTGTHFYHEFGFD
ncbi:hypothetical protein E2C01_048521 [Portunus trituberculatus]|uniref:Uncharacterized protein n=1 Tax=Portunus trituberculatus TaxID=210409 RepID=A0A5B7GBV1_PORTR|nr:hypothetical protein [Portunus trituberculatus]